MTNGKPFPALEEAIRWAGGLRKLAALLERPPTTVYYWRSKGRIPNAEDVLALEKVTEGRVSRARLAPRIFGKRV